jgi:hypothetical protein
MIPSHGHSSYGDTTLVKSLPVYSYVTFASALAAPNIIIAIPATSDRPASMRGLITFARAPISTSPKLIESAKKRTTRSSYKMRTVRVGVQVFSSGTVYRQTSTPRAESHAIPTLDLESRDLQTPSSTLPSPHDACPQRVKPAVSGRCDKDIKRQVLTLATARRAGAQSEGKGSNITRAKWGPEACPAPAEHGQGPSRSVRPSS